MDSNHYDISVLYVEDEEVILEQIAAFLKSRVREVFTAANGEEGLRQFEKHNPDMVFSDIRMPSMTGLEMATEIKRMSPDTPIVIVSAYSDVGYMIHSIETKINKFILKPVKFSEIEEQLAKYEKEVKLLKETKKEKLLLQAILDYQETMIILTDGVKIVDVNKSFCDFFGCAGNADINISDYFVRVAGYAYSHDGLNWLEYILSRLNQHHKAVLQNPKNEKYYTFLVKVNQFIIDSAYFMISFIDITELESETKIYEQQAYTDSLTQVYNRLKFDNILHYEISRAQRYKRNFFLIMFDIDSFKQINDNYGHLVGDEILKEVVGLVNRSIRNTDILTRWGGDEFIILGTESDLKGSKFLAERIRKVIHEEKFPSVGEITCSFGVTDFRDGDTVDGIMRRVDNALLKAKRQGKNQVVYAEECD